MKRLILTILCCLLIEINAKNVRLTRNNLAQPGEFPYIASIQYKNYHICGATLITKKHVLTAAHCIYKYVQMKTDKSLIKIVIGSTNLSAGIAMDVDRISYHWAYQHSETFPVFVADVAVIRLKNEVTLSSTVGIAKLPGLNEIVMEGTNVETAGFGSSQMNRPPSPVMKKTWMQTINRDQCVKRWAPMPINNGLFCAIDAPGHGICEGDSGGPLIMNRSTIIGTISAVSINGCGSGMPDVFTKISLYLDYIRAEISNTNY